MPLQHQSSSRGQTVNTSKKLNQKIEKTEKIKSSKSQISQESGTKTSIRQKIICYLFCCCNNHGKST